MRKSALVALGVALAAGAWAAPKCDERCLTAAMEDYLAKTIGHRAKEVKLAPNALLYLNTRRIARDENPLERVKAIRSKQIFCDAESGNVMARTGVELEGGKIAYASTRLKVVDGAIAQVETSFDDGAHVVPSYVSFLDPLMTTIVPAKERMTRAELKAIIARYFQALSDHKPEAADFDDRCDRYHSGQRITNNPRITVEGGSVVTCFSSVGGNPPWGPATDIHIPLIDPEHGIVVGYTLLLYQNGTPPMYVSEVFKILGGRIRMIDNIGLKAEGMKAMNLPE